MTVWRTAALGSPKIASPSGRIRAISRAHCVRGGASSAAGGRGEGGAFGAG